MTLTEPSVSTDAKRRTKARRHAIRIIPSDGAALAIAVGLSGRAAIARLSNVVNRSTVGSVRNNPSPKISPITPRAIQSSVPPKRSSFCWSGVSPSAPPTLSSAAIRPISVLPPVATTTPRPVPAATVADGESYLRQRPSLFEDALRFTRQGCLAASKRGGAQQMGVGRDEIARFVCDHVASHNACRRNRRHDSVPPDSGLRRGHPFQRRDRLIGAVLLIKAPQRIPDYDREKCDRLPRLAENAGNHASSYEEPDQDTLQLRQEDRPWTERLRDGDRVRSISSKRGAGLCRGETVRGRSHPPQAVLGGQAMSACVDLSFDGYLLHCRSTLGAPSRTVSGEIFLHCSLSTPCDTTNTRALAPVGWFQ